MRYYPEVEVVVPIEDLSWIMPEAVKAPFRHLAIAKQPDGMIRLTFYSSAAKARARLVRLLSNGKPEAKL